MNGARADGDRATSGFGSRLPALGSRGGGWVILQLVFLGAAVTAGVLGRGWPSRARVPLGVVGGIAAAAGIGLVVAGGDGLGTQLTPFPRPVPGGALKEDGVYGRVRHPMYGGALLVVLGWALLSSPVVLVPLVLAAAFVDAKSRREEAWLTDQHPEYADYRRRVRSRFVPWLW